ncbi:NfeD family protein [Bacillus sp. NPDC094106]|uniref:NfeD family protein n=1 Tax=Bacillus sp. NPDC094106 TaxID=3363949 RepID=UPI00381A6D8A
MISIQIIWAVVFLTFIAIDLCAGTFLIFGYGIGALVSYFLSGNFSVPVQITVFLVIGTLILGIMYPLRGRIFSKDKGDELPTNSLEGKVFTSPVAIEEEEEKQLSLGDTHWFVINQGSSIQKGEDFVVLGYKGNKLLIKKKGE